MELYQIEITWIRIWLANNFICVMQEAGSMILEEVANPLHSFPISCGETDLAFIIQDIRNIYFFIYTHAIGTTFNIPISQ